MSYRMLIIDGNYLARSRFEAGSLAGGFLAKMFDLRKEHDPGFIAVAWDPEGGDPVRKKLFSEYKAKRKPRPAEFNEQVRELQEALPWFSVVQYGGDGEADDVIATVCQTMPGPILVWTADKDMLQLINHKVHVCKPGVVGKGSEAILTPENIKDLTGKSPKEWLDFLILRGDAVDGVPGLSKVGDKRANDILAACPSVVNLIIHGMEDKARASVLAHDASQAKWIEKAIEEKEQLILTEKLVKLRCLSCLNVTEASFHFRKAIDWLDDQGLKYLAERIVE